MTVKGMRRSIIPLLAVVIGFGAVVAGALFVTDHTRPDSSPSDVRTLIDAYLANVDAAREEYRDTLVTASGVVAWSARDDEITSRLNNHVIEKSDKATVLFFVDDRHRILACFDPQNQSEALALRQGDRVTIKGWHQGNSSDVVYAGKVLLSLHGCELVR